VKKDQQSPGFTQKLKQSDLVVTIVVCGACLIYEIKTVHVSFAPVKPWSEALIECPSVSERLPGHCTKLMSSDFLEGLCITHHGAC
jgi:hypothetical protein